MLPRRWATQGKRYDFRLLSHIHIIIIYRLLRRLLLRLLRRSSSVVKLLCYANYHSARHCGNSSNDDFLCVAIIAAGVAIGGIVALVILAVIVV